MRLYKILSISTLLILIATSAISSEKTHPSLVMTPKGVQEIHEALGNNAAFDKSFAEVRLDADRALSSPIIVPTPKDGGGGYTHEKHKDNYYAMFNAGVVYQITKDKKYSSFVRDMLSQYAKLYPTLGYHPVVMSSTPGRLFWQTLNECVWLVHTSIAYDCVYDALTPQERTNIENNLLRPMATFIMDGMDDNKNNNKTFNKMHNHGTWATAAVGMVGYTMGDQDMVDKALYGSDKSGKNGGFMQQLGELFSPDGYFTEGAYYQRYAIWPFVVFAQAINNNQPQIGIFTYRDNILKKAVNALTQLAYEGRFFLINDAMPKGYDAQELVYAIDIIYNADPSNKQLLDIAARYQNKFLPTDAGYAVARDIALGQAKAFEPKSVLLSDGADASQGAVAILRNKQSEQTSTLVFKATSHGLSHGHYDKLMFAYYDNGNPVIQDYGAARFVNIEAKYKGHYTPENKTWAMSTIAHNTVTIDETSHFKGNFNESSKYAPSIYLFDSSRADIQIVSAKDINAYPEVKMQRTMAYIATKLTENPIIVDIFRLESSKSHTYDYPIYYNGQMMSLNMPYTRNTTQMSPLSGKNGYQHLWVEATANGTQNQNPTSCFTWLTGDRFYSINTLANKNAEYVFARSGANDPNFHLRSEPCYMIRQRGSANHTFLSTIESHGKYDLVVEQTSNAVSSVKELQLLTDTEQYTIARITLNNGSAITLCIANNDNNPKSKHSTMAGNTPYKWNGAYAYFTSEK